VHGVRQRRLCQDSPDPQWHAGRLTPSRKPSSRWASTTTRPS